MKKKSLYLVTFLLLVCAIKLFQIGYKRIHFSSDLLLGSFKKSFGDELALGKDVLEANKLISEENILDFNLSHKLMLNNYFRQRIVEFSYPKRLNKESKFLITSINENLNCTLVSKLEKVKLYEC